MPLPEPGTLRGDPMGVRRGSSVQVPEEETHPIIFEGTIIYRAGMHLIDNGTERYIIEEKSPAWD